MGTEPQEISESELMPSSSNSAPFSILSSQLEPSILDMNEIESSISTSSTSKNFKMSTTSEPQISETSSNLAISQSTSENQSKSIISTSTLPSSNGEAIISTTETQSFLALKVSNMGAASRPFDLPRVAPGNAIVASKRINVNEPSVNIKDITKKTRQSEDSSSGGLPGVNDILTGL